MDRDEVQVHATGLDQALQPPGGHFVAAHVSHVVDGRLVHVHDDVVGLAGPEEAGDVAGAVVFVPLEALDDFGHGLDAEALHRHPVEGEDVAVVVEDVIDLLGQIHDLGDRGTLQLDGQVPGLELTHGVEPGAQGGDLQPHDVVTAQGLHHLIGGRLEGLVAAHLVRGAHDDAVDHAEVAVVADHRAVLVVVVDIQFTVDTLADAGIVVGDARHGRQQEAVAADGGKETGKGVVHGVDPPIRNALAGGVL